MAVTPPKGVAADHGGRVTVMSQILIVPSRLLDSSHVPPRVTASEVTRSAWPRRAHFSRRVAASQTWIVPSSLAEASQLSSGASASAVTWRLRPSG